jgi:hypothetical protein
MLQLFGVDEFQLAREAVFSRVAIQFPYIRVSYVLGFQTGRKGHVRHQPTILFKDLRQNLAGLTAEGRVIFPIDLTDFIGKGNVLLEWHTEISNHIRHGWFCRRPTRNIIRYLLSICIGSALDCCARHDAIAAPTPVLPRISPILLSQRGQEGMPSKMLFEVPPGFD